MADPLSESQEPPDMGAIEQGDTQATADAILSIYQQLQAELERRASEIARLERRLEAGGL